jgi:dienelactone hydrolase
MRVRLAARAVPRLAFALAVALAAPLAGQSAAKIAATPVPAPNPYDATRFPVVVTEGSMRDVAVARETWGDGLAFEVTRPTKAAPGAKLPGVVFVNGVGGKLHEWEIYRSWARLVAARGLAGVTFETKPGGGAAAVTAFFAHLASRASGLGLDADNLAAWACSANVSAGLPAIMATSPIRFQSAVIYYGSGEATIRKDLLVYWVLALRDDRGLVARQKAVFERAVRENFPWTMVVAPDLPHAFDGAEDTPNSRRVVKETLDFLVGTLRPPLESAGRIAAREPVARTYAREYDKAAEAYRAILAKDPSDRAAARQLAVSEYNTACVYALAGAKDEAFRWLNRAAEDGFVVRETYERDADLAGLRSDPRWPELLARLGR